MEDKVKMNDQVLDTALESAENLLRVAEVLSSKANSILKNIESKFLCFIMKFVTMLNKNIKIVHNYYRTN